MQTNKFCIISWGNELDKLVRPVEPFKQVERVKPIKHAELV